MATQKQLAALKKGREARAKKLKGKAAVRKKTVTVKKKKTVVKNPVRKVSPQFIVEVKLIGGRVGYLAKDFTLDTELGMARKMSQSAAEKNATLFFNKNKKCLAHVKVIPAKKSNGAGYKKNPVPESSRAQLNSAARLFEDFTGHDAEYYDDVPVKIPKAAAKVGLCDGIMYETIRDGKVEHYVHKFKKLARPALAVSSDGRQLLLIGGKFAFTERGIVDN